MRRQPAKWIAENPDAYEAEGTRSFWLNAFSSPWVPWEKIVLKFLQAQGDPQKLKVVYNTLLGQLWENRGDLPDEDGLMARREDYGINADGSPVEVPEGVLVLTCGVDTQTTGWSMKLWAMVTMVKRGELKKVISWESRTLTRCGNGSTT